MNYFLYYLNCEPSHIFAVHPRELIDRIAAVSLEDVKRVALKYFTPLIDPTTSRTVIVCHPSNVQETVNELQK